MQLLLFFFFFFFSLLSFTSKRPTMGLDDERSLHVRLSFNKSIAPGMPLPTVQEVGLG